MRLIPLKSQRINSGDDLFSVVQDTLKESGQIFEDGDILIIASKAVSYAEGGLVNVQDLDFSKLVKDEADRIFDDGEMVLTLKNKILIPNAGIDRSNVPEGKAVLWPEKPFESAQRIRQQLMSDYDLRDFGVLITDSHCQPLRAGTTGIGIGWAGFYGVLDERGKNDLFGRRMAYTQIAVADNLASAATIEMGETDASVPFVLARDVSAVFTDKEFSEKDYYIPPEECIYRGIYGGWAGELLIF